MHRLHASCCTSTIINQGTMTVAVLLCQQPTAEYVQAAIGTGLALSHTNGQATCATWCQSCTCITSTSSCLVHPQEDHHVLHLQTRWHLPTARACDSHMMCSLTSMKCSHNGLSVPSASIIIIIHQASSAAALSTSCGTMTNTQPYMKTSLTPPLPKS